MGWLRGDILSDGEVQTGNACAYWDVDVPFHEDCWQVSQSMGTAGKLDMAEVFLHLNADVNIECVADQAELQQMLILEGEDCFLSLHWLWPQSLPQ